MNYEQAQALNSLAAKLGTTAEYLWAALIRQAAITGAIDAGLLSGVVLCAIWFLRFVNTKTKTMQDSASERESAGLLWVLAGAAMLFAGLIVVCSLSTIVAALFNPEYWALMQILR